MNSNIEQILLAQAANEAEQIPGMNQAVAMGAGGGALLGAAAATPVHMLGKGVGSLRGTNKMLKPGARMAGGLVGLLMGGALGAAARQQAVSSPDGAGALLAKIQSQGGKMTTQDQMVLETVLRDAYTQQGLLA